MKERLDVLLVKQGLADSREKAKVLIMAGDVYVNGQKEDKAGSTFDEEKSNIEVRGVVSLACMFRDDFVEFLLEFLDFASGDLNLGGLSLDAAHGLVDHDTGVGQGRAFAWGAGAHQHSGHRSGHPSADGGHIGSDELHGVVDAQTCIYTAAR